MKRCFILALALLLAGCNTPVSDPTATPTPGPTATPLPDETPGATATPEASPTPTPGGTATPSPQPGDDVVVSPRPSSTPEATPTPTPTSSPQPSASPEPTATPGGGGGGGGGQAGAEPCEYFASADEAFIRDLIETLQFWGDDYETALAAALAGSCRVAGIDVEDPRCAACVTEIAQDVYGL